MTFKEVINAFREGKNITRKSWTKGFEGINREWCGELFEADDVLADDWEVTNI
jgi:hypothetical protein